MSEKDYKNGWDDGYQECLNLGEEERLIKEFNNGRKQGALEELEKVYDILLGDGNPANKTKKYVQDKLLELKEGVGGFL